MKRLVILLLPLFAITACGGAPYPQGSLESLYPQAPRPRLVREAQHGEVLSYAEFDGARGGAPLLFVHGTPGDWQAWARYLDDPRLAAYGTRRAVDRPGFGAAADEPVMTDLRAQADLLARAIPAGPPAVLVGHSLGAPLVAWMAIDHPGRVCGAVLVAGSIAPEYEAPRWFNELADTWLGRRLLPETWRRSNDEIMALQNELRRLDAAWSGLRRPLVVLQGGRDELVNPKSADYAARRVPAAMLDLRREPDAGHFVLWKQPERVIAAIQSLPCAAAGADTASSGVTDE